MQRLVLLIALPFFLFACVSQSGTKVSQEDVAKIEKGVTTEKEIVERFGPPAGSSIESDGTKAIWYVWSQLKSDAANFIPYVGWFAGKHKTTSEGLTIWFDKNDVVREYAFNKSSNEIGKPKFGN